MPALARVAREAEEAEDDEDPEALALPMPEPEEFKVPKAAVRISACRLTCGVASEVEVFRWQVVQTIP